MYPTSPNIHPAFDGIALGIKIMEEGAKAALAAMRRRNARSRKQQRGLALQAGTDTPRWNILAAVLKAECKKYGDQSKLARTVGLSRQRMNNFLHGKGGLPDAERTLMLLEWLGTRRTSEAARGRKAP